jgi:cytoskeletal protein CcmA (bactofilin family)
MGDNSGSVGKGSYLAEGSKISGRLSFEGSVRIDGEVEGEVDGQGTLEIGESGVVTVAKVEATSVIVAGKVRANIISQQVEICATGNVRGDVAASAIVIHAGGELEGNVVKMRSGVGRSTSSERDVNRKLVTIMSRVGS